MNRIAIFIPSLRGGGAEWVMMTLANCFAESGYNVDLVLVQAVGPYLAEVASNVRIIDLGVSRTLFAVPGLIRYLRREQPHAMLSAMAHINVIAVLSRRISGSNTKLVISERNHASCNLADMSPVRRFITKFAMQWAYPQADGVTAVSLGVADDLARVAKIPRKKIRAIYNPVVTNQLIERAKQEPDHPWLSLAKDTPVILAAGRLTRQKDFRTLIRSLKMVRRKVKARLILLGEGECRKDLERLVRALGLDPYVSMPGFLDNPFAYMRKCGVFVLSSRWEGLPGVLIQAMALRVPVVSTDCPSGPAEILENGRWGRLVPVGDPAAMAEAIVSALRDSDPPEVKDRLQDFTLAAAVDRYLDVIIKGCGSNKGGLCVV